MLLLISVALVHDLAESIVGDITPYCGVSKEDKKQREMDAMREISQLIAPRGERLMELFEVWINFFLLLPNNFPEWFEVLKSGIKRIRMTYLWKV